MASVPTLESRAEWRRRRVAGRRGLALVATLLVLAVMGVLVTAAVRAAMSSARTAGLEYHEARAFYAAEAGVEAALAQLKIALQDGLLEDDELADIGPPDLEGFSYDSFSVERRGQSVVEPITDGPFAGLYGLTQNVEIHSQAEDRNRTVSGVVLEAKAQAIPIFQFGVFFEEDLEGTNGPPMEFLGRVHSNGNIYLSSQNAWYRDMVTTPNSVFHNRKDHHLVYDGVYINDAEANEVPLDFDSRTIPGAEEFKAESCAKFDCRLQTNAFEVDSLRLPLPQGVPAYDLIRPRAETDDAAQREVKFAWNADTYVTVDLTDIRTKGTVCSGGGTPPEETEGEITISALGAVYPEAGWVTFRASHPALSCDEFDSRATLRAVADGWSYVGAMGTCTFQVYIGSGANELEIEIEMEAVDYTQLEADIRGRAKWMLEEEPGGGDETPWPSIRVMRSEGREVPGAATVCNIFQWKWSAFYDGREEELKDVLDIDIDQLNAWVGGTTSRLTEIIYVEFVTPPNVLGYSQEVLDLIPDARLDPAIRVTHGAGLANRLTVAAEWPLYVLGNYNSVNKQPSALASDGITILSTNWSDGGNRPPDDEVFEDCEGLVSFHNPCPRYEDWAQNWRYDRAAETTVNAAILAGHWPTPCDHAEPGCPGGYADFYGGGLENFPRFLEEWRYASGDRVILHYLGALVSPFTSRKTTGTWNGTYYVPPQRDWSFDTDFRDPARLPPGTPNVGNVIRTAMREAF